MTASAIAVSAGPTMPEILRLQPMGHRPRDETDANEPQSVRHAKPLESKLEKMGEKNEPAHRHQHGRYAQVFGIAHGVALGR
jgi:hypothetical protein